MPPPIQVASMCATCSAWIALDIKVGSNRIGNCCIRAPQSYSVIDSWPQTKETSWCKEWSTK